MTISSPSSFIHSEKSFSDIFFGANAFYSQPEYLEATKQDLSLTRPLLVSYTWNTEHKIIRIAKQILSIIVCPTAFSITAFSMSLSLIGKISLIKAALICSPMSLLFFARILILPASCLGSFASITSFIFKKCSLHERRSELELKNEWKYKRITIETDGYKIDSIIAGKPSTFNNGRWTLISNGNGELYEFKLDEELNNFLSKCNSNAILFNYPGVGVSSGLPSKQAMVKAYRAMLTFLEDEEKGIGAKEIIGSGFSLGGGIQGEALRIHPLKKDIKYVFIKDRTFSSLSRLVPLITCKFFGFLIKPLGWEMDSVASSQKLQAPEIILQATLPKYPYENYVYELKNSNNLAETDGVIEKKGSLAFELLELGARKNKHFLGIRSSHNDPLDTASVERLSEIVNKTFSEDLELLTQVECR